ncbi:GvpL/GvpF family gas vesicle protein [Halovivax gelatinilyticus]|uniref:GvpL/GvpF family gas vesicle protein n=1 Tax=Halovivax gelatinilyticus TaxID=2961597 RepID=UPI0020CA7E07|nr:GvpL/GvpF family gas vesicle protein [Halovivax gelatinilyticus]
MTRPYAYGVVDVDETIERPIDGVGDGERVYPIENGSVAALVSDIETASPERSDENVRRHDDVLRELMTTDGGRTVVPMRYGMVFRDEVTVENVLDGASSALERTLREIEGTEELGVTVVRPPGGGVDDDAVRRTVADELDQIAADVAENGLYSDRLVLNRSYLVRRDERDAFDEAVGRLESQHEEVLVRYTGPFAPYSFVDVRIGAQQ